MGLLKTGKKQELTEMGPLHSNPLEVDCQLMHQQLLALVGQRKKPQLLMNL
jgi:hypothetical protein